MTAVAPALVEHRTAGRAQSRKIERFDGRSRPCDKLMQFENDYDKKIYIGTRSMMSTPMQAN